MIRLQSYANGNAVRREQKVTVIHPAAVNNNNRYLASCILLLHYDKTLRAMNCDFLQTWQRWYRLTLSIMMRGKVVTKRDLEGVSFPWFGLRKSFCRFVSRSSWLKYLIGSTSIRHRPIKYHSRGFMEELWLPVWEQLGWILLEYKHQSNHYS